MVTHIVLFKFEDLSRAEEARRRLLEMRGQVPSLVDIEVGVDFTRGERNFELGLVTRHQNREGLEAYRIDPVHQRVAQFIREHSSGAAAVDFESED